MSFLFVFYDITSISCNPFDNVMKLNTERIVRFVSHKYNVIFQKMNIFSPYVLINEEYDDLHNVILSQQFTIQITND